jgi:GWxTD domain-containing protein
MKLLLCITTVLAISVSSFYVEGAEPKFEIREAHVKGLSAEMQREIGALQYILNPYQLRQFFSLPSDSLRREWVDSYWKALDPTPTTEKNERAVEHYVRTRLALQAFATRTWPGWDKRGEIFIRYGAPNYRGKIHAEVTARKVHPPGELWYYKKHAMIVKFEDFNLDGRYNYAMTPMGLQRDMDPELMEFLLYDTEDALQEQIPDQYLNFGRPSEILVQENVEWSPLHEFLIGVEPQTHVQPRMRGMHEGMDENIDPDAARVTPENPSTTFHKERIRKYANNFEAVLLETPSAYPFNFEDKSLPFFFGIDQFRGGEDVNRIEVNIEINADLSPGDQELDRKTYTSRAVFFDAQFNEIASNESVITLPTTNGGEENSVRLVPAQLVFTLPEQYYRIAVSVTEQETNASSAYRSTMAFSNFRYDLAISDILFASKIAPAERQSPFNRGALEVVPHPIRRYLKDEVVPVYFEIYNLELDDAGVSQYTVEYRIVPHSPRKAAFWDVYDSEAPIVSSRFESSSYGATDQQYVSVDTDNLWEGAFDLLITIRDELTQAVVYRKATFRIVE